MGNLVTPLDFDEALAGAETVFAGKLVAVHDPIPLTVRLPEADLYLDYAFEVDRLWKGTPADTLWVRSYREPASGGVPFRVGETYLVYAVRDSSHLWTNRCSRTIRVGSAYGDLYLLGEPVFDSGSGRVPEIRLSRLLHDLRLKSSFTRLRALRILEEIEPEDPEVLPAMLEIFADSTIAGRPDIAASFGRMGENAARAVPALARALGDPEFQLRIMAAAALGRLGKTAREAVPALVATLQTDPDPAVRAVAAQALGSMGAAAETALPALREALSDSSAHVQNAVARALQLLEGKKH